MSTSMTNPIPPTYGGYLGNFGVKRMINGYSDNRFTGTFVNNTGLNTSDFVSLLCATTASFGSVKTNSVVFGTAIFSSLSAGTGTIQTLYINNVTSASTGGIHTTAAGAPNNGLLFSNYAGSGTGNNLFIGPIG